MTHNLCEIKKDLVLSKSFMVRKWHVTKFRSDVRCVLQVSKCIWLKGWLHWCNLGAKGSMFSLLWQFYTKSCWPWLTPLWLDNELLWANLTKHQLKVFCKAKFRNNVAYFICIVIKKCDRLNSIHDCYSFSQCDIHSVIRIALTKRPARK